jgi:hypothetical protein
MLMVFTGCYHQQNNTVDGGEIMSERESEEGGDKEIAITENGRTFTISEFNSDNPDVENIDRPSTSTISTSLDTALLFGIWTTDPEGPHADFRWTKRSIFIVDYDGNGDMPFDLIDKKLKVYFNDFIQEGTIQSVDKDSLIITWDDSDQSITYVRWMQ